MKLPKPIPLSIVLAVFAIILGAGSAHLVAADNLLDLGDACIPLTYNGPHLCLLDLNSLTGYSVTAAQAGGGSCDGDIGDACDPETYCGPYSCEPNEGSFSGYAIAN